MLLFTLLLSASLSWGQKNQSQTEAAELPEGVLHLSQDAHFSPYVFVVDKNKRTLSVYQSEGDVLKKIIEHPTDIGKNSGPKTKQNDFKTPVGIYFLQKELRPPKIPFNLYGSLAFTTDYPNIFDQRDAKTGHGIWLHAVPDTVPLTRGSRGCVVVRNNVIKELKSYIKLAQTPLLIFDHVQLVTGADYKKKKEKLLEHFEKWRSTWENQDVDSYIKFYDSTFKNAQMNYDQWYKHKKKMKEIYKYMKVSLSSPLILINQDQVVIRTIQRYESDLHQDYGEKTLHAHWSEETGFKIIREDWTPLADDVVQMRTSATPAQQN